jgi:hypothetical protein
MLTHIVIFKYKAGVKEADKVEHLQMLKSLPSKIKEIRSFQVDFDILKLPRSYDLGLVAIFEDRAGLDAYTTHPEHVKVAEFGKSMTEHIASVDFLT